jgi:hypothetical protein
MGSVVVRVANDPPLEAVDQDFVLGPRPTVVVGADGGDEGPPASLLVLEGTDLGEDVHQLAVESSRLREDDDQVADRLGNLAGLVDLSRRFPRVAAVRGSREPDVAREVDRVLERLLVRVPARRLG